MSFTLFAHQRKALNYLRLNDSFMLTMEQGCGKTLPSLVRMCELIKAGEVKQGLICCPKSVIGSWERDIELFPAADQKLLLNTLDIINYDMVWRSPKYKKDYDLILCDEAHNIVNRSSKRAKFLLKASVKAKFRYLLTGTPINNGRLEDSYALICFLDPYIVGGNIYSNIWKIHTGGKGSYYDWCNRYAELDQYYKPYKYKHINEVQLVLKSYSYSVKKIDCLDLPEKLPDEIRLLELAEPKLYKQLAKDGAVLELDLLADNPLVKLGYLRQLVSGHLNGASYSTSKTKALEELLLELGDKKLVIFAEFRASIDSIITTLKKLKITYITQDGRSDKNNWKVFQADDSIQVIVCQYQSANQGIDLFKADTILYYEPTLRSSVLDQSRSRIHRNGQKNVCSYIFFLTKGTVEEKIYKAVNSYIDFGEKLFKEYMNEYQRSFRNGRMEKDSRNK